MSLELGLTERLTQLKKREIRRSSWLRKFLKLVEIFKRICTSQHYEIDQDALEEVSKHFQYLVQHKDKNFGNGREARRIFERITTAQASRVVNEGAQDILLIKAIDVTRAIGE